jgi:hypothetical protein
MAVDDGGTIDMMSFDKANGDVVLTISDHLDWSEPFEHQELLQRKFNTYLAFVENGELVRQYPEAKERPVVFRVVFKFKPEKEGRLFLERARQVIESAGFRLRHELCAESYNN